MEEEIEAQEAEQPPATEESEEQPPATEESEEQPPATQGSETAQSPAEGAEEETETIGSIVLEDDGPTTRKIQTEFTVPCKGPVAEAMAAAAVKGGSIERPGPVFQPCGDMPLPPGADPWQWGFPEFCPRKMMRYAEAAAAAAAAAEPADSDAPLPGEAADTLLDEEAEEPASDAEPVAEEKAHDAQEVNLSALSEQEQLAVLGEETATDLEATEIEATELEATELEETELEETPSDDFMDAIGMEEHIEWYSDTDFFESNDAMATIKVDIEVDLPSAAIADAGSVEFQAPAAAEEGGSAQEEATSEQPEQQQRPEEGPGAAPQPQQMDATEATEPLLWKIEQEIAVVRSKLSEMQQKITALDIADLSGGGKPLQRRKCVCDPQKRPAARGLPAPALPVSAPGAPPPGASQIPETGQKYVFHSAPCLQQHSFTNVARDFRPFPQQLPQTGGGVDIYIASRSGNTSAVTSINPANFQQYAEKPVLKAFASPDVDVYVVTDSIAAPGYSGQS